ncbi:B-cell linker protein isoform X3 [Notolabrus celidotus]|uniref:B-cell linker protein isoform X3 n=1 Tax=Notolabrus celidotus TaxID=1203425 RepID=UPI00148F7169|nr:B-cell linker protein isoform X3 [Notolabrus celidotus]
MNLPSREECEGWDQAQVACFMSKNKMPECAAVVNRLRINGQKLLSLSDRDMSKFSVIHQPQLQKIVQDIKKNDGSLLNKLKRLKSKPVPKVPARDYRAEDCDDQLSDSDYDNDMYENPHEEHDDSYMPPPSHRAFTTTNSASFQRGEYLDNCHNQPERPPRKPLRPVKASKELPPKPPQGGSDEEDYIDPDGSNYDEDDYVQPDENPPPKPVQQGGNRTGRDHPRLPSPLPLRTPSPGVYIVPDKEESSLHLSASRLCPTPAKHSPSLPPKPGPRINIRSPVPVEEPIDDDEYEVCDPDNSSSNKPSDTPPKPFPKPLPRESPKPPLRPRPEIKPREFESRTLPVMPTEPKIPPKTFTLDLKRPKIPLPQFTSPKAADKSVSPEDESANQDKDADVYRKSWYANTCDRKTAYEVLYRANKDGAFMVRKSSGQDMQQPYTLVVIYHGRVYNIPIRFIPGTKQYALGSEKKGEEYFNSVAHIIENHQRTPLVLIDSQSNSKDSTKLCHPVKP